MLLGLMTVRQMKTCQILKLENPLHIKAFEFSFCLTKIQYFHNKTSSFERNLLESYGAVQFLYQSSLIITVPYFLIKASFENKGRVLNEGQGVLPYHRGSYRACIKFLELFGLENIAIKAL